MCCVWVVQRLRSNKVQKSVSAENLALAALSPLSSAPPTSSHSSIRTHTQQHMHAPCTTTSSASLSMSPHTHTHTHTLSARLTEALAHAHVGAHAVLVLQQVDVADVDVVGRHVARVEAQRPLVRLTFDEVCLGCLTGRGFF